MMEPASILTLRFLRLTRDNLRAIFIVESVYFPGQSDDRPNYITLVLQASSRRWDTTEDGPTGVWSDDIVCHYHGRSFELVGPYAYEANVRGLSFAWKNMFSNAFGKFEWQKNGGICMSPAGRVYCLELI